MDLWERASLAKGWRQPPGGIPETFGSTGFCYFVVSFYVNRYFPPGRRPHTLLVGLERDAIRKLFIYAENVTGFPVLLDLKPQTTLFLKSQCNVGRQLRQDRGKVCLRHHDMTF